MIHGYFAEVATLRLSLRARAWALRERAFHGSWVEVGTASGQILSNAVSVSLPVQAVPASEVNSVRRLSIWRRIAEVSVRAESISALALSTCALVAMPDVSRACQFFSHASRTVRRSRF